jgi:hypothetical protein
MSTEDLQVLYEAVNTNATFEEFVWFVGNETDVPTILSWFKDSTVH